MSMADIEKVFRREVSKINKLAINKISVLENYVKNRLDILEKCFIFAQEHQYGDKILNKLINYIPEIKPHYDEHADKKNLEEFATGNLKCIVNCKKLNEGINMKSLSNIILVSSESKRQLIQRLGRVLRIDEEKHPDKRAFVLDFIENRQLEKMEGADYSRYIYLNELAKIKKEN
jgi:superfamily II DNA or RNA helicase